MDITNKQNHFFFLLAALLILLFSLPIISDIYGTSNWFTGHLTFSITLIFSVLSLKESKKWLIAGVGFLLCSIIFSSVAIYTESTLYLCLSLFADFLFLVLVISVALQQVVFTDQINLHNVAGAVCVYLLLGIIWAVAYYFVDRTIPGSFKDNLPVDIHLQLNDYVYYSFVTLSTLGYGDIVPLSATARSLAYLEAIFGQFYMAILVAGLVSIHIRNQSTDSQ